MRRKATRYTTLLALAAGMLATQLSVAQPTKEYTHGDPTADEQYILELINRARATPAEEGVRLMDTEDAAVQQAYSFFHIDKAATKTAFTKYPQRPPLAFHPALIQAARGHTADMVANNFQGHVSTNGDQLGQRFQKAGYQSQGQFGENVSSYSESVWYGHCGFNVDWGEQNQQELGHRSNVMNFTGAVYTEFGAGITKTNGSLQSGKVGPYVITEDFGLRSVRYITGVVYNDKNQNGIYDPGEGLSGVKVSPDKGEYYAVSSTSGGYAIPYTGNGSVVVTASGGGLTSNVVKTISFTGDSYKLDFILGALPPGVVTLLTPANNATKVAHATAQLTWQATSGADGYEVHVASTQNFTEATMIYNETVSGTSTSLPLLACNTKYYWRARGRSTEASGEWSTVFAFTTDGTAPVAPKTEGMSSLIKRDEGGELKFGWSKSTGATLYHLQVSSTNTFDETVINDSNITTNSHIEIAGTSGLAAQRWYWRVRAQTDCGWSTYSNIAAFDLTITSVEDDLRIAKGLTMVPNPVTANAMIYVPVEYVQTGFDIAIRTVTGQNIASKHMEPMSEGMVSLAHLVDPSSLSIGAYIVTITNVTGTKSLMFTR